VDLSYLKHKWWVTRGGLSGEVSDLAKVKATVGVKADRGIKEQAGLKSPNGGG